MPAISCSISMATVERFALDMYVDTTAGHGQAAGSAATSAGEDEGDGGGQRAAKVPRGYEIQIAIVTAATEPSWGLTLLMPPGWRSGAEEALSNLIRDDSGASA